MAKKKIDLKDLLLEKGERIGLGVAAFVMIVLVVVGTVSALSNDSPGVTASYIQTKASAIENKLSSGPVLSAPPFKQFPPLEQEQVQPADFVVRADFFLENLRGDGKRNKPSILAVSEGRADPVHVQVKSHMFSIKGRDVFVYVLIPRDTKAVPQQQQDPRLQRWLEMWKQRYGDVPPQFKQPGAGLGGMPGAAGLQTVNAAGTPVVEQYTIQPVPIDRIPPGAKLAERVQPYRMAVVTAAFPYGSQVQRYIDANIFQSVQEAGHSPDLLPQFLPFKVRRRSFDAQGNLKEDWKELDYEADIAGLLQYAVGVQPEDDSLKPLLFQGLVLARPQLTERTRYPAAALPKIDDTLKKLAEMSGVAEEVKVLNPLEERFRGGLNIFDTAVADPKERPALPPRPLNPNDPRAGRGKELFVPPHCLVRFMDVTVQPGHRYEYQFLVRVKNPNEGKRELTIYPELADLKELSGQWGPEQPISVSLGDEEFIYAVELDDKTVSKQWPLLANEARRGELIFAQVHKWIESTRVNPEQRNSEVKVGDWVIGEVPVRRGEYIGKLEQAEVPVWFETRERFDLAVPPPPPRVNNPLLRPPPPPKGIPVDFTTPNILVDWEGGKINQTFRLNEKSSKDVREEANVEVLVLSADGKLRVRNSQEDNRNKQREERYNEWKKWIEEVRSNQSGGGKPAFDPFKR